MDTIRPQSFAHVVYRTRRFAAMLDWYRTVFGATVQFGNDVIAFLAYDEEHHRVAIVNLDLLKPRATGFGRGSGIGADHVAYGFRSLVQLLEKYEQLKSRDITPYWSVHHGITVSLYYADPDGNQMEFQVDSFASVDEANAFMRGPHFEVNPIGVEFDPDAILRRLRAGEPEEVFLKRPADLPVSELKGTMLAD